MTNERNPADGWQATPTETSVDADADAAAYRLIIEVSDVVSRAPAPGADARPGQRAGGRDRMPAGVNAEQVIDALTALRVVRSALTGKELALIRAARMAGCDWDRITDALGYEELRSVATGYACLDEFTGDAAGTAAAATDIGNGVTDDASEPAVVAALEAIRAAGETFPRWFTTAHAFLDVVAQRVEHAAAVIADADTHEPGPGRPDGGQPSMQPRFPPLPEVPTLPLRYQTRAGQRSARVQAAAIGRAVQAVGQLSGGLEARHRNLSPTPSGIPSLNAIRNGLDETSGALITFGDDLAASSRTQ